MFLVPFPCPYYFTWVCFLRTPAVARGKWYGCKQSCPVSYGPDRAQNEPRTRHTGHLPHCSGKISAPKARCCNVTAEILRSSNIICETAMAPRSPQERDLCAQWQCGAACQGGTSACHISPTTRRSNALAQTNAAPLVLHQRQQQRPNHSGWDGRQARRYLPHAES